MKKIILMFFVTLILFASQSICFGQSWKDTPNSSDANEDTANETPSVETSFYCIQTQTTPPGWIVYDYFQSSQYPGCPLIIGAYNVAAIARYDNAPANTTLDVCTLGSSVTPPSGWQLVTSYGTNGYFISQTQCGRGLVTFFNVARINKIPIAPTPTPTPTPVTQSPIGYADRINQTTRRLVGWSFDPDNSSASNSVHFYIDGPAGTGTYIGQTVANLIRPDVNTVMQVTGNHGFAFPIPSQYFNGNNHTIYAYGIDLGQNPPKLLIGSPKSFNFAGGVAHPTQFDFDGDTKADVSIFRPNLGQWWFSRSSDGSNGVTNFGINTDKIVPADYTGDGKTDIAVFRSSIGVWYILRSEDSSYYGFQFGISGDIPVPADYDGDGKADAAVFRPSNSTWYVTKSTGGEIIQQFGANGDVPVVGDYDGDGKSDIAIYRTSLGQWWYLQSSDGTSRAITFGNSTDKPVQSDFTGDGKTDIAIFRPSSNEWFVLRSEDGSYYAFPFGASGDILTPADYDLDGKTDAGVFRPSTGIWYIYASVSGTLIQSFGTNGDIPVPSAYNP